jgi:hypothetical protein
MADTITEKVIWTLCPNGRDAAGRLHLSAFIAPRLTVKPGPATTLDTAAAWLNWPKTLKACEIKVVVPGSSGDPLPVKHLRESRSIEPSPDVYGALFSKDTPVVSYNTDTLDSLKTATILSYPVKVLADYIETFYKDMASSPVDDMPSAQALAGAGWPGYRTLEERRRTAGRPRPTQKQRIDALGKRIANGPITNPKLALEAFSLYHAPLQVEAPMTQQHFLPVPPDAPKITPPKPGVAVHPHDATWPGYVHPHALPTDFSKVMDFHKIAAGLSNYYQLSRLCGFVIDFVMEEADAAKLSETTQLAFHVRRNGAVDPADICAITECVIGPQRFEARGSDEKHEAGFLKLHEAGYDLVQLDVDGAAHKAAALGGSLERMTVTAFNDDGGDRPRQDDMQTSAPSLRSAGLMVAKSGRGGDVKTRAQRNSDLNGVSVPDLTFSDLLRGYRADILDLDGPDAQWRSLHRRNIAYTFRTLIKNLDDKLDWAVRDGVTVGVSPVEEGVISTSVGSSADGTVPGVFTLHEGLFVWRGWSLSAPEPFKVLRHTTDTTKAPDDHASMIGENTAEVPKGLPLQTVFTVAHDPHGSLPKLRFGHRYSVRLRAVDLCGNSRPLGADVPAAAHTEPVAYNRYEPIESPVVTLVGKVDPGDATCRWRDAEYPLQGESMTVMALRTRNATYDDPKAPMDAPAVHRNLWPPRVTQRFAEQHGVIDDVHGRLRPDLYQMLCRTDHAFAEALIPVSDAIRGLAPISDAYDGPVTHYAVSNAGERIPYLPDPLALGVKARLRGIGDPDWKDVEVSFFDLNKDTLESAAMKLWDEKGPYARGITIEGREDGEFGFKDGVLTVPMKRGSRQRLRLSCMVPASKIELMALWSLIKTGKSATDIRKRILDGRHWMFTPWREIELVHAVQKPLEMPGFIGLKSSRAFGGSDVAMTLTTPVDGPSTVRLDVNATWNEPDDNSVAVDAKNQPVNRPHRAQVVQLPITRGDSSGGGSISRPLTQHFHDTRARRVTYTIDAISRFREFFELPLRDSETDMKITSAPRTQWVKSSARPPAPVVLYAVPTFGWFAEKGEVNASRRTGGIRVWLDRPWLTTGYNEMLAVILPEEKGGDSAENLPFVTQWGRDPIWLSSEIATNSPAPGDFPLARLKGPISHPGAGLPEDEGKVDAFPTAGLQVPKQDKTVAIAPHEVGFDADRQLWYADIAVKIPKGSYFPFIRLAVARFQPMSLSAKDPDAMAPGGEFDLHLSAPVTCDFMQITPDRIAVIVPIKANVFRVVVYGDAPTPVANDGAPRTWPTFVTVQTQVRDAKSDPVTGWRDADGSPPATGPLLPGGKTDTSEDTARAAAARLMQRDLDEPIDGPRLAIGGGVARPDGVVNALAGPKVLFEQIVYAPLTPTGGSRRVLITETEMYMHMPAGNHEEDPVYLTRVVYAEGLEF